MRKTRSTLAFLMAAVTPAALPACGGNNVLFVSKKSFSLEAAEKPPAASLGLDSYEGYVVTKPQDGKWPSLISSFETDGTFFSPSLCQFYILGDAADAVAETKPDSTTPSAAAGGGAAAATTAVDSTTQSGTPVLISASSTTLGLRIGFASPPIDSIVLGYRRIDTTAVHIPDGDDKTSKPSIVASFNFGLSSAATTTTAQPSSPSFHASQYLLSGPAAAAMMGHADLPSELNGFKTTFCSAAESGKDAGASPSR